MIDGPVPPDFVTALHSLRDANSYPGVELEEVPAPRQIAPWTAALTMRTTDSYAEESLGSGRLVVLYDPEGQEGWNGTFRIVAQLRTHIDPEMRDDPFLGEALWCWAHDCLNDEGAGYHSMMGTVTRELSEAFGGLALRDSQLYVDIRASWSPSTPYLSEHLNAWVRLMCLTAGVANGSTIREMRSTDAG